MPQQDDGRGKKRMTLCHLVGAKMMVVHAASAKKHHMIPIVVVLGRMQAMQNHYNSCWSNRMNLWIKNKRVIVDVVECGFACLIVWLL